MKFAEKIKSLFKGTPAISPEFFDDLSDILVEGDFGAAEAYQTTEALREVCKKEKAASSDEVRSKLAGLLEAELQKGNSNADSSSADCFPAAGKLVVILLLGVNGVGKTTSCAKLASMYYNVHKRKPILAAADTFRAAAIDQLKIHGERLGMRVVAHQHGGDPAAVVYDAIESAQAGNGDIIIADTAGRMHTKTALVEELRKIDRVVESKAAGAQYIKYLVLDATTGRNALVQAETFCEAVKPQGVILTKYDSTAKGGVVFSLASALHLPVLYLCTGEKYEDIKSFDPKSYVREFIGIE